MKQRGGATLASRLIVTTTALVLGIVVLFGAIDVDQQARIFDAQSRRLEQSELAHLERRGEVQTRDLAEASRTAILQNDYSTLQAFVPQLEDPADHELAWVFVADHDGLVLAHTDPRRNGKPVADPALRALVTAKRPASRRVEEGGRKLLLFSRPIAQPGADKAGGKSVGAPLGAVVLAFDLAPLDEEIAAISRDKRRASRAAMVRTAVIGLLCVLVGTAITVLQSLRISRPLAMLAWSADQLARGDLESRVEVGSHDEIGRLGRSFNFMADQLKLLLAETAEKAVLEKELEVARAIQETLVPPVDHLAGPQVEVAGHFAPASHCGGDWWTMNELGGGRVLVVIGDVTGHGAPAAMITACAKSACDTLRELAGDRLGPAWLLAGLNRAIHQSARRRFFMTCFAAILDPAARRVRFANAGHNFPYLVRGGELQSLGARGNRLGDVEGETYQEHELPLEAGDLFVWFTDGVTERESERGEEYGDRRFRAAIRAAAAELPGAPLPALRERLLSELSSFAGARPPGDDVTLVLGRYRG